MYKNESGISLSLAVWLAHDDYDHNPDPNTISATTLLKPLKQIVLGMRVPSSGGDTDISSMIASSMGTAYHNDIEHSWVTGHKEAMARLGYPKSVIDRVVINPSKEFLELNPTTIPIYMEQRSEKRIGDITVSGKYDFVAEGQVEDFKSTGTFTYIKNTKDNDYILQGSIYRWLNPDIITKDTMLIQFIFTDWSALKAKTEKDYPPTRILTKKLKLLSLEDTEIFIRNKLNAIIANSKLTEEEMTPCTSEELWRNDPVYKYYKGGVQTARSTKNFDNQSDAYNQKAKDGNVGLVVEVHGEVKACNYCNGFPICKQKDKYINNGTLKV